MKEDDLEIIKCHSHNIEGVIKDILLSGKEILYHISSEGRAPLEWDHMFFLKKNKK